MFFPKRWYKQNHHRKNFKSSCKHIKAKDYFAKDTHMCKICSCSNILHTRTYIVETGNNRGKGGDKAFPLYTDKEYAGNNDKNIYDKICVYTLEHTVVNALFIHPYAHNLAGTNHLL